MNKPLRDNGLVLIIGQVKSLGCPMVGEPEGMQDVLRGTASQRAEWMAKEQVIATVRLAASRSMPLWIPQESNYSSLAAMILSEYAHADAAEDSERILDASLERKYLLNLFRTTSTRRTATSNDAWHRVYMALGVMPPAETILNLAQVLERKRPKLMVCIGSGPKVSAAKRLAGQFQVHVEALDFSKERSRKLGDNGLESKIVNARRNIQLMRVRSARVQPEHEPVSKPQAPANVYTYPPVPLLVYWQLEHYIPSREIQ